MIKLEGFKQSDISRCGPASIKMVLDYYGIKASEDEIAKKASHSYELGCTNENTIKAFKSYGITAELKEHSTTEQLKFHVKHDIPVIVDWFSHGTEPVKGNTANGHYSVVIEVDDEDIYLMDPEDGKQRAFKHSEFLRVWFDWQTDKFLTPKTKVFYQTMIIPYRKKL